MNLWLSDGEQAALCCFCPCLTGWSCQSPVNEAWLEVTYTMGTLIIKCKKKNEAVNSVVIFHDRIKTVLIDDALSKPHSSSNKNPRVLCDWTNMRNDSLNKNKCPEMSLNLYLIIFLINNNEIRPCNVKAFNSLYSFTEGSLCSTGHYFCTVMHLSENMLLSWYFDKDRIKNLFV